ncbi:Uncharacterised protein [Bordetella pertussis]|nr:Uncharacterised protein [Bordetella pertussis]CFP11605.1 Uncharacterised protein [Bordetella pertussis]CPO93365.1 Uncharacterised protein [Bordetella pertussis]
MMPDRLISRPRARMRGRRSPSHSQPITAPHTGVTALATDRKPAPSDWAA